MTPDDPAARDLDDALDALLTGAPLPPRRPDDETLATLRRLHRLSRSEPDPAFVRRLEADLRRQHAGPFAAPPAELGAVGSVRPGAQPLPWDERLWRTRPRRRRLPLAMAACLLTVILLGIALAAGRDDEVGVSLPAVQPSTPATGPRAVLLVMDVSGSMSYDPLGGTSKIDMAKEAARVTLASLETGDWFGLLAFNDQQSWVVPLAPLGPADQRQEAERAIGLIVAEGGTEIYPALAAGLAALATVPTEVKHLILLTDGKSRTGTREEYRTLVETAGADIVISTVAIGSDADTDLMQFLAEIGAGNYQYAESADEIPLDLSPATPAARTPVTGT